ncbi:MAG: chemotaxis protein CheW [Pseudomonadota bacterium]
MTFLIETQLYALRAEDVSEVMLFPVLAHIPQGPAALLGVANLRGSVLPVASLRELLGKPAVANTPSSRAIVLDMGSAVAIVVDAVETLETATQEQIETHSNEFAAADAEKLIGIFSVRQKVGQNKSVAKILDIKALLESAFINRARPQRQLTATGAQPRTERAAGDDAKNAEILVTFEVAGQEFGLPLAAVQEIIPVPSTMTHVARAEAVVLGVISVRNSLLPLLSLRGLLGFGAPPVADGSEKIVVVKVAGTEVGLVTDRARSIVVADSELVDPVPSVLAARTGGESRIKAIYRGDGGRRLISILSPEQLFREDVMQKLVTSHKTQHGPAASSDVASHAELIFLVFKLGNDEFGLPIDTVVEVAQVPAQITRVPKTPKFLEGVVNLRGEVLPVVDQRRRFDMPKLENTASRRLVVIRTERHRAGLIVDSVADVLRISADAIEPAPDLTDDTTRLVRGVINLEKSQRLVLVLDPAEVLTRAEQGLLDTFQAAGKKTNA